jgi:hypothetical protein
MVIHLPASGPVQVKAGAPTRRKAVYARVKQGELSVCLKKTNWLRGRYGMRKRAGSGTGWPQDREINPGGVRY